MRGLQGTALFNAPHRCQQFRRRQLRNWAGADPGKYVAFEPGQYPLAVTPDPGFHLLVDPLARNHFEAVRRALYLCGFGGAAVLAGIDAGVEQLARLDGARAGLLQIDFRVDAERHPFFLSGIAVFEAPPLAAARRDLEIQAVAVEHPDGIGGGFGVARGGVGERHLGATPFRVRPVAPKIAPSCQLRRSQDAKRQKKTRVLCGFGGSPRMFSEVIGRPKWWSRGESNPRP